MKFFGVLSVALVALAGLGYVVVRFDPAHASQTVVALFWAGLALSLWAWVTVILALLAGLARSMPFPQYLNRSFAAHARRSILFTLFMFVLLVISRAVSNGSFH